MNFAVPLLAALSLGIMLLFKVLVIWVGLSDRSRQTSVVQFFAPIEVISGLVWILSDLFFVFATDSSSDELWVKASVAMTVWLMIISLGHCLEIRKLLAAPILIFLFGIINLFVLRDVWYSMTYEATW